MSTRSYVGRINEDGSVDAIYVHMDGYTTGNGIELYKNFQDPQKVDALIKGGSRSSLDGKPYADEDSGAQHFTDADACIKELSSNEMFDIQYVYFYDRRNEKELRWSVCGLRPDSCYGKPWTDPLDIPSAVVRECKAYVSQYANDPEYGKYARGYAKQAKEWEAEVNKVREAERRQDAVNFPHRKCLNRAAEKPAKSSGRGIH